MIKRFRILVETNNPLFFPFFLRGDSVNPFAYILGIICNLLCPQSPHVSPLLLIAMEMGPPRSLPFARLRAGGPWGAVGAIGLPELLVPSACVCSVRRFHHTEERAQERLSPKLTETGICIGPHHPRTPLLSGVNLHTAAQRC